MKHIPSATQTLSPLSQEDRKAVETIGSALSRHIGVDLFKPMPDAEIRRLNAIALVVAAEALQRVRALKAQAEGLPVAPTTGTQLGIWS